MRHLILAILPICASFGAPAFAADANPPEPSRTASQHHHRVAPKHTTENSKQTATTSAVKQGVKKTPDNKALAIIPP